MNSQEMHYIPNESRLPVKGDSKYLYSTVCRLHQWRWNESLSKYVGIFKKSLSALVDPYALIPSIGISKLKAGADVRLMTYYNVIALRTDLEQQLKLNLKREELFKHDNSLKVNSLEFNTLWFKSTHTALWQVLYELCYNDDVGSNLHQLRSGLLDGLNEWDCDLWFDRSTEQWLFKCDRLLVTI